jgi:sterol desaturase/sphingolipid hydroxylase (fatty acid hydroxylase superfamily)
LVPIVLLGIPPQMWLALYLFFVLYTALSHSDLDLSFGSLDRLFVSPRFHAAHHSANKNEYDANFGSFLCIWDVLFASARFIPSRPHRYGISHLKIPASFIGQLLFPLIPVRDAKRAKGDDVS